MRLRKWVLTDRAKRWLRGIGLVLGGVLAIGLFPPALWALLLLGIGYGVFRLVMRVRRERLGETRTF